MLGFCGAFGYYTYVINPIFNARDCIELAATPDNFTYRTQLAGLPEE
jgi:hypothetical protein